MYPWKLTRTPNIHIVEMKIICTEPLFLGFHVSFPGRVYLYTTTYLLRIPRVGGLDADSYPNWNRTEFAASNIAWWISSRANLVQRRLNRWWFQGTIGGWVQGCHLVAGNVGFAHWICRKGRDIRQRYRYNIDPHGLFDCDSFWNGWYVQKADKKVHWNWNPDGLSPPLSI